MTAGPVSLPLAESPAGSFLLAGCPGPRLFCRLAYFVEQIDYHPVVVGRDLVAGFLQPVPVVPDPFAFGAVFAEPVQFRLGFGHGGAEDEAAVEVVLVGDGFGREAGAMAVKLLRPPDCHRGGAFRFPSCRRGVASLQPGQGAAGGNAGRGAFGDGQCS